MKQKKKHNATKTALIILIIAVLIIGAYFIINAFYITEQIIRIPVDIRVSDAVGFNLDTDALHFGAMPEGSCATRFFNVSNNRDYQIRILLKKQGNTSAYVSLDRYDFKIPPKSATSVKAKACIPIGATKGNYTGSIAVHFRKF